MTIEQSSLMEGVLLSSAFSFSFHIEVDADIRGENVLFKKSNLLKCSREIRNFKKMY